MIEIDYKKHKKNKHDFIVLPCVAFYIMFLFYQHGSEYIRKVSLLGSSPNTLLLWIGVGGFSGAT